MARRLTGSIGGDPVSARFEGDVDPNPDAAIAAFLMPAMARGEALAVEGDASPGLLEAIPDIQRIVHGWWPEYRLVDVQARRAATPGPRAPGVASFFSGGVDSFYTALTNHERITHLVFVHGFDIALSDTSLRERAAGAARTAAAALGKPLFEVATDLRLVLEPDWEHYHGAALAAVGHQLCRVAGTVMVPASYTYEGSPSFAWGSHPLLDPLWSGDRVRFVHDGAEVTRLEKTEIVAKSDVALTHLRVCWENRDGAYNCGRCEKCLRTMVGLRLCGALERCATFPEPLDLEAVKALRPVSGVDVTFTEQHLTAARERDPELAAALAHALRRGRIRRAASPARRAAAPGAQLARKVVHRLRDR
jgi:hypothetical protein